MLTVIFDMDGVLFDSERLDMDCWKKIAKVRGLENIEVPLRASIGANRASVIENLHKQYGNDFDAEDFIGAATVLFDEYVAEKGMPIKPFAKECLSRLKENGARVGLASSTNVERVKKQLTDTGLIKYFDDVVGGGMYKKGKPDPEVFLTSCERLKGNPATTFVIEDSFNGIRAAFAAGMKPVMVPDLLTPNEEITSMCHKIFTNLKEAYTYILQE